LCSLVVVWRLVREDDRCRYNVLKQTVSQFKPVAYRLKYRLLRRPPERSTTRSAERVRRHACLSTRSAERVLRNAIVGTRSAARVPPNAFCGTLGSERVVTHGIGLAPTSTHHRNRERRSFAYNGPSTIDDRCTRKLKARLLLTKATRTVMTSIA
jgi:hypothetical protein